MEGNQPPIWPSPGQRTYILDLESSAFDAFLIVNDAAGKKLDQNDDLIPGVNLNSRLIFEAPKSGVYRIVATSFEQRQTGPYTILCRPRSAKMIAATFSQLFKQRLTMKAVKAIYENGKVTLSERLSEPGPMEVLVVFPEATDDPWQEILEERKPRPAFAKFAAKCLDEIEKGKAKPLNLDDL